MTADKPFNVLFLCTGNSARSIMAEAILAREGEGKFQAFSAGSFPKGEVHPNAIELLKTMGYQSDTFRSKSWDEFSGPDRPKMDFIFTVCDNAANETCPIWPGQPITAHWGIPDPVAMEGSAAEQRLAFADAYKMLKNCITIFVNLPFHDLGQSSVIRKLREIGQTPSETA